MMRVTFSVLMCCGLMQFVPFVYAQESPSRTEQLLFSDDFAQAAPDAYQVEGAREGFVIEGGALALSQGAKVSRDIQAENSVSVDFDLRVPKQLPAGQHFNFSVGFPIDIVQFRCAFSHDPSYQSPGEYRVVVELLTKDGDPVWTRQVAPNLRELDGHWRLTFEDGRVAVEREGKLLFQHLVLPNPWVKIERVELESYGAAVQIDALSCHGQRLSDQDRRRLRNYGHRSETLRAARAASADHRHADAARWWQNTIEGWALHDQHTPSVAFIQMEAGLAEIANGRVPEGLSRLEQAWPALLAAVDGDHPWRIAGEALLREAHRQLKRQIPDRKSHPKWDAQFAEMWQAWADISWQGKSSLEPERQLIQRRWKSFAELDEKTLAATNQFMNLATLAQATFAQGDVKRAHRQAQTAIHQLEALLQRGAAEMSFLHEEFGDLLMLSARCQFLLLELDRKDLERIVRSSQNHWNQSLHDNHPQHLVAAHNLACLEYLDGNWIQAEENLRRGWKQSKELLGEGAPETLETKTALGMLQLILGQIDESEELRIDTLWRYAELTTAGWLPGETPTLDVFSIRQELNEHPSLIMVFSAAAPGQRAFDPLVFHKDSLTLARLAARVDQMMMPFQGNTPWNTPSDRAKLVIEKMAPPDSPLRTMSRWLGFEKLTDDQFAALPEMHPWRVWLRRRDGSFSASGSPPAAPATDIDEFRQRDRQLLETALDDSVAVFGEDHPESAWCHEALAVANYTLGRFDEAKMHAAKSTAVFAKRLEPHHVRTLATKNTLGVIEYYRQDLRSALNILQENVRDRRSVLGNRHVETLRSLNDLAVVSRSLGRLEVARMLIDGAIKDWPPNDEVGQSLRAHNAQAYKQIVLVNRCVLQAESGDYASAEAGFQALLLQKEFQYQQHEILLSLSSIAIMQDNFRKAEGYLLEAQKLLRESQFPRDDPQLDHSLGVVYRELGDLKRSREYLQKALNQRSHASRYSSD